MPQLMHIHRYETRLEQPLRRAALPDAVNPSEDNAHLFEIAVTLDGAPVTADEAYGTAIRPDGVTVVIPAGTENGTVSLVLPRQALAVPGETQLLVCASRGSSVTTVLWCTLTVLAGRTDEVADPEELIPDLDALLTCAQSCEDAAALAVSAAERMSVDSLAQLFCVPFDENAASVTCHPLPGSAVHVSAAETAGLRIRGRVLWKRTGYIGGANYYYVTGSNTGNDVPLPAGVWTLSYRVNTDRDFAGNGPFTVNIRPNGPDVQQRSAAGWTGSFTVTMAAAGTLSVWMVNNNERWNTLGRPTVDLIIADAAMDPSAGDVLDLMPEDGCVTAPEERQPLSVWTADGSPVSVSGYTDPVWLHRGRDDG